MGNTQSFPHIYVGSGSNWALYLDHKKDMQGGFQFRIESEPRPDLNSNTYKCYTIGTYQL